jgi:hypothetical protein
MLRRSDNKNEKKHFQMDRFIQQNGEWFYVTREDEERGPFITKDDAQGDLITFIMEIVRKEQFGQ